MVVLPQAVAFSSKCYTVRHYNPETKELRKKPIIIFGVVPGASQRGLVWLMASDAVHLVSKDFFKKFPAHLNNLCDGFESVECLVDTRNTLHLKWVQAFGFNHLETRHIGDVPFALMNWSPTSCVSPSSPPPSLPSVSPEM